MRIAETVFLIYVATVAWLIWRLDRVSRAVLPHCPQCGVTLSGDSLRIAAATGRCDACGGQVIADPPATPPPMTSR
jgi:predicted RNA-binding Zn-ribbon protein involved in translation (DUF1610 family)